MKPQPFQLKLLHKGLILVLVPLLIELAFVCTLWRLLNDADKQTRRLEHAKQVSSELNVLNEVFLEAGRSGAMYKYVHTPSLRDRCAQSLQRADEELNLLEQLCTESPQERAAFQQMKPAVMDLLLMLEATLRKVDKQEPLPQVSERDLARQLTEHANALNKACTELADIEKNSETEDSLKEAASRQAVMNGLALGIGVNVLGAICMAMFFYRELLTRLRVLMENTHRVSRNAPLLPRITGGDEIEHLDDVFHKMAQALSEAAQYKKELIAMVSHDLRTPLTSIQTSLALLEVGACGNIPERALQEIEVAERSATRLINLINDLLDVEKMEAGKLEMTLSAVNTQSIIERAIEGVGSFAEQHQVRFKLPQKHYDMQADGDRLVQVLVNLLSNAIKFSPDGSLIAVDLQPMDNGKLRFSVTDEGPGIPAEQQATVFERFKQGEAKSDKLKGTGLGLAICKAITQGHGGDIGVTSGAGGGTTFWFTIPGLSRTTSSGTPSNTSNLETVAQTVDSLN